MAKKIDHKYVKGLLAQIHDHLGSDEEGENPSIPEQDNDVGGAGQRLSHKSNSLKDTVGTNIVNDQGSMEPDQNSGKKFKPGTAKSRKDAAMALLASNLASKFNK